jgi:hypothetical protein
MPRALNQGCNGERDFVKGVFLENDGRRETWGPGEGQ